MVKIETSTQRVFCKSSGVPRLAISHCGRFVFLPGQGLLNVDEQSVVVSCVHGTHCIFSACSTIAAVCQPDRIRVFDIAKSHPEEVSSIHIDARYRPLFITNGGELLMSIEEKGAKRTRIIALGTATESERDVVQLEIGEYAQSTPGDVCPIGIHTVNSVISGATDYPNRVRDIHAGHVLCDLPCAKSIFSQAVLRYAADHLVRIKVVDGFDTFQQEALLGSISSQSENIRSALDIEELSRANILECVSIRDASWQPIGVEVFRSGGFVTVQEHAMSGTCSIRLSWSGTKQNSIVCDINYGRRLYFNASAEPWAIGLDFAVQMSRLDASLLLYDSAFKSCGAIPLSTRYLSILQSWNCRTLVCCGTYADEDCVEVVRFMV